MVKKNNDNFLFKKSFIKQNSSTFYGEKTKT